MNACITGQSAASRTNFPPSSSRAEKAVAAITRSGFFLPIAAATVSAASGSFKLDTAITKVPMPRSRRAATRATAGAVSPPRTAER